MFKLAYIFVISINNYPVYYVGENCILGRITTEKAGN